MKYLDLKGHRAKILNPNTKQSKNFIRAYERTPNFVGLYDVYAKPSANKHSAFVNCLAIYEQCNGNGWTITGHNCDTFTFMWLVIVDGVEYLIVETAYNRYAIEY